MVYLEPNPDYDEEEEEEWDSETQEFVAKDVAKIDRHRFGKFSNLADGGMFEERRETVSLFFSGLLYFIGIFTDYQV